MDSSGPGVSTLDDPEAIAEADPSGMFPLLARWPGLWQEAAGQAFGGNGLPEELRGLTPRHVVIAGMGGSAIGGDLLHSYVGDTLPVPLVVNRSYVCPGFVGPDTLFVAVSYSGNTEETLSSAAEALEKGAAVVGVTSGGRLKEMCGGAGRPVLPVPPGLPPRQALGPLFVPVLGLLQGLGLIGDQTSAVEETGRVLQSLARAYGPDRPIADNPAKGLAAALYGKIPVVYGVQGRTDAVALRWRGQFHENSKNWAASNVLPELDHNEINSWASLASLTREAVRVIYLEDPEDGPRMARRREVTRGLIDPFVSGSDAVRPAGGGRLARLFSLVLLGDFVSCYLAVLNRRDPLPVPVIEDLKKALAASPSAE